MQKFFLIFGSIIIVIGLIFTRIRFLLVLDPDTELFINILNRNCSKKETDLDGDLPSNIKGKNKT